MLCLNGKLEYQLGDILVSREFIPVKDKTNDECFSFYTFIRRKPAVEAGESQGSSRDKNKPVASIVIIHGNSENSDNFLEVAFHHALNNIEVHMIDLKG